MLLGVAMCLGAGQAGAQEQTFDLTGNEVGVFGDLGDWGLAVEVAAVAPGVEVARLRLTRADAATPPQITLRWSVPSNNVVGQWTTRAYLNKTIDPDWGPSRVTSMLAQQAPVLTLFGSDDGNRLTYAVSDGLNAVTLTAAVREEDARIYNSIALFREPHNPVREVTLEVRFDARNVPYSMALGDVASWWAAQPGYAPAAVPADAREPVYSTWYSYHQSVAAAPLLEEVEAAKELGYETIIVDDGWQTLDSQRGYAFTGDWQPERIPEMGAFVDGVHERGMKILLWYALPFVGENSAMFERFDGKFLRYWDGQGAYVLDPRYPEVREFIVDTYRTAMRDWGLDGFKLDFIGRFVADEATVLTAEDGRDYASVNEATDRLMSDVLETLRAMNPDVMIEFRQPYVGPLMRKYGNLFRAGDAPNSAAQNRVRIVDLRLLSGDTAVHSDMLMWAVEEPVESAALQLLSAFFAVPQISVQLADIPDDHLEMVRFWNGYWLDNREILLDGSFEAAAPLANYPVIRASDGDRQIIGIYAPAVVTIDGSRGMSRIDIVNASGTSRVVVDSLGAWGEYSIEVWDARGAPSRAATTQLTRGGHAFDVPVGGLLRLSPRSPR
jgi:alpha-galactosidase